MNGERVTSDDVLVLEATDCENGLLLTFETTERREVYRIGVEVRSTEVLKSGDLWLLHEEE